MPSVKKMCLSDLLLTVDELIPNHCQGDNHPVTADILAGKIWMIHSLGSKENGDDGEYTYHLLKISLKWMMKIYIWYTNASKLPGTIRHDFPSLHE